MGTTGGATTGAVTEGKTDAMHPTTDPYGEYSTPEAREFANKANYGDAQNLAGNSSANLATQTKVNSSKISPEVLSAIGIVLIIVVTTMLIIAYALKDKKSKRRRR